jgi:hypothetical protein
MKPHSSVAMLYSRFLYEEEQMFRYNCPIHYNCILFSDPCFAKDCSPSERCLVKNDDKTTCGKFDMLK